MIDFLLLICGLLTIIIGSRFTVNQAVIMARRYRLSDEIIGILILSIGSNLPEIAISIHASFYQFQQTNTSGLILGNVLGSNFSQIGLIMGLCGLFGYLTLGKRLVYRHGGVLLGSVLYLLLVALDEQISRVEGAILVLAFIVYIVMLIGQERREVIVEQAAEEQMFKVWLLLIISLGMVLAGSELIVSSTVSLAEMLGISQSLIAIVIIGVGSSLPELVISLAAIMQSRGGMSVANLLGANIIDAMLPVGLAAMIYPLSVEPGMVSMDIPLLFLLSLIVLIFLLRRRGLQKHEAVMLILFYAGYILLKFQGY